MILNESPPDTTTKQCSGQLCPEEDVREKPSDDHGISDNENESPEREVRDMQVSYSNPALVYTSSSDDSASISSSEDEVAPEDELRSRGWMTTEEGRHELPNGLALPGVEPPVFGEVTVKNSTNVHLGNRTFCKGPVTIKQFIYSNTGSVIEDAKLQNGNLEHTNGDTAAPGEGTDVESFSKDKWYRSKRFLGISLLAILVLTSLVVWLSLKGSGAYVDEPVTSIPPLLPNDSSINNDPTLRNVLIVPRVQWGAQPPVVPPTPLKIKPPIYVIISHTVTVHCYTQAQCVLNVRVAQTFHIESKGWNDISYNFLIGGDGLVYEGRGWDIEGAHTYNYNDRSIGISFIGTFNHDLPTKAQLAAAKNLISFGVKNGKIAKDYKLLGHRQCIKTESPGEALYNIIRTWDHWSPTP